MNAVRPGAGRQGFTLIEVLVALAVTVTAIVALTLAVGVVSGAWGRGGRTAELDEAVARAASRFHDDVASLVPWRYVAGGHGVVAFDGERRSLRFAGVVRTGAYGAPRLRVVQYRVVASARGFDVERSTAPMPGDLRRLGGAWTGAVALVGGVDTPEFAFATPTPTGRVWHDSWPAGAALPSAIRLSFAVAGRTIIIEAPVHADPRRDCLVPGVDLGCEAPPGAAASPTDAAPQANPGGE